MARRGLPIGLPRYYGGLPEGASVGLPSTSGGLLMLLVGAWLLLMFLTGRLSWFTDTIGDVFAAHDRYSTPSAAPGSNPVPGASAAPYSQPARPQTFPVYA